MDDKLIAEIRAFLRANPPPNLPTDAMLSVEEFRRFGYTPRIVYPVASKRSLAKAEADIGFQIPNLLKRLYLEVSNGIAGFAYEIIGLEGGCTANSGTLVEAYFDLKVAIEYFGGQWKPGLLPFCDWGCAICSCVDCADPASPVLTYEDGGMSPEGYMLPEFFEMWLKGNVRFSQDAEIVTKEITNPFTKTKTTVSARKRRKKPPK